MEGTKKTFLADFHKNQPTESIIKECYFQFKLDQPDDITKAELLHPSEQIETYLKPKDTSLRWGDYAIPDGGILIFRP